MSADTDEQKNAPELPIGRFLKSKSLGGNRVIFAVLRSENLMRRFLFIFGFETPAMVASNRIWNSDFEDSESLFIEAANQDDALQCGRIIANRFLTAMSKSSPTSISIDDYAHWIEDKPEEQFSSDVLTQIPVVDSSSPDSWNAVVDAWLQDLPRNDE